MRKDNFGFIADFGKTDEIYYEVWPPLQRAIRDFWPSLGKEPVDMLKYCPSLIRNGLLDELALVPLERQMSVLRVLQNNVLPSYSYSEVI